MAMRTIADVYKPLPASEVWNARMMGEKYKETQRQKQVERLMAQSLAEMNRPQPGTQPPPTSNTIANLYRQGTPEAAQAATALEGRENARINKDIEDTKTLMGINPEGAVAFYNNSAAAKKFGKAQYLGKRGDWNIIKSEDGSETAHRTMPSGELESQEVKPAATVSDKYKMEDGHIFNETKGVATPIPGYTPKKEFAVSDGFMYDKGTGKGSTIPGYTPKRDAIDTASQAAFDDLDKLYLKKASLESMRDEFGGIISSEDAQTSLATIKSQIAKREALIKSRYPQEWATYSGGVPAPSTTVEAQVTPAEKPGTIGRAWNAMFGGNGPPQATPAVTPDQSPQYTVEDIDAMIKQKEEAQSKVAPAPTVVAAPTELDRLESRKRELIKGQKWIYTDPEVVSISKRMQQLRQPTKDQQIKETQGRLKYLESQFMGTKNTEYQKLKEKLKKLQGG